MMSQRDFYTLELFSKIKPILKQSFLLHCPTELIKFFCNCLFNVVHGGIRMTANLSVKKTRGISPILKPFVERNVGLGASTSSYQEWYQTSETHRAICSQSFEETTRHQTVA